MWNVKVKSTGNAENVKWKIFNMINYFKKLEAKKKMFDCPKKWGKLPITKFQIMEYI